MQQADNGTSSDYKADTVVTQLLTDVLSSEKVSRLTIRVQEIKDAICRMEIVGTAEEITNGIAMFHLMKGKLDAFEEILEDHRSATDTLASSRATATNT